MFINLSNHASDKWSENQKRVAEECGEIMDITFPEIDPYGDESYIDRLVDEYFDIVMKYGNPVVMLQGEFTFTYRLIQRLKNARIKVVAACSERKTVEFVDENGISSKKSLFEFVRFREY